MEQAGSEAGMEARHIPVTPGAIRDDDAARFRAALDGLPGPTVAFCRTGTRSAMLWALSNADERSRDELIATAADRSEEHTSELQSLMRISYAVFCLKKKKQNNNTTTHNNIQTTTN